MVHSPPESEARINPYGETQFRIVENLLRDGEYVSPEMLSRCVHLNPGRPLPPLIEKRICDYLDGNVTKRRGRRPGGEVVEIRNLIAVARYQRYLVWLQKRKKRFGLKGWAAIRDAKWWRGPPSERARRMALAHLNRFKVQHGDRILPLFPSIDEEHLRNLISAYK